MQFVHDDAGAPKSRSRGDCVCRAVTIASGLPYDRVYKMLADGVASQRLTKQQKIKGMTKNARSARNGVDVRQTWFKRTMTGLGFTWYRTIIRGFGCTAHLKDGELPMGRLVVLVSKHYTAVIDGVIRDKADPQRDTVWFDEQGNYTHTTARCVYGYWKYNGPYPLTSPAR